MGWLTESHGRINLVLLGGLDVLIETLDLWIWVLDDLGLFFGGPLGLWLTKGREDWVRANLDEGGFISATYEISSSISVSLSVDHIFIELHVEVVKGILGNIVILHLGLWKTEFPFVAQLSFTFGKGSHGVLDILINTEVWNEVVHWVRWGIWLFWVWVLVATRGIADWVRLNHEEGGGTKSSFGIRKVLLGVLDILVEVWSEVVVGILGNVVVSGLGLWDTEFPVVTGGSFGNFERVHGTSHIWISSMVSNWIVHWVTSRRWWV